LNDNATRGTLSVNQSASSYDPVANPTAGLAAWAAVFSGMVALSNDVPNVVRLHSPRLTPNLIINPAGVSGTNSALARLWPASMPRARTSACSRSGAHSCRRHFERAGAHGTVAVI